MRSGLTARADCQLSAKLAFQFHHHVSQLFSSDLSARVSLVPKSSKKPPGRVVEEGGGGWGGYRGGALASLSVPEQMSPVLTLSRSRWVLGERSPSYGRLNGLIVKFSHGAPGYDRRQNYTIIKGHWICIGIHYFVKRPGHTFAYYWPRCLKCLKCALPSLRSSCWVILSRQESKQRTASLTKVIGFIGNYFRLCLFQISLGDTWHFRHFHCTLV